MSNEAGGVPVSAEERLDPDIAAWRAFGDRFMDPNDPIRTSETPIREAFAAGWDAGVAAGVSVPTEPGAPRYNLNQQITKTGDTLNLSQRPVPAPAPSARLRAVLDSGRWPSGAEVLPYERPVIERNIALLDAATPQDPEG